MNHSSHGTWCGIRFQVKDAGWLKAAVLKDSPAAAYRQTVECPCLGTNHASPRGR